MSVICLHIICYVWPMGMSLSGATFPGQSEPRSNVNKMIIGIPKAPAWLEPHHQML